MKLLSDNKQEWEKVKYYIVVFLLLSNMFGGLHKRHMIAHNFVIVIALSGYQIGIIVIGSDVSMLFQIG